MARQLKGYLLFGGTMAIGGVLDYMGDFKSPERAEKYFRSIGISLMAKGADRWGQIVERKTMKIVKAVYIEKDDMAESAGIHWQQV